MKYLGIILIVATVCSAGYVMGRYTGRIDCRLRVAAENQNFHAIIIKKQEEINAETFHSNTADIRGRLREKYTIAE